jgi:hypothetical protein
MTTDLDKLPLPSLHAHGDPAAPDPHSNNEWQELGGDVRHHTVEVLRLIMILLQDSVILIAGFAIEFIYEHYLRSTQPFFRLAINISSAMFLLLYGVMVTVHVVNYVRKQFGATAAGLFSQYLPWGLAAAGVIAAVVTMALPRFQSEPSAAAPARPVERVLSALPANTTFPSSGSSTGTSWLAISPDGRRLAYVASGNGETQLYLRNMDALEAVPLAGTEGAYNPFFSPDGEWIGFANVTSLKKISVNGGAAVTLLGNLSGTMYGASWGPDNTIVFGLGTPVPLMKVSAAGGDPRPFAMFNRAKLPTVSRSFCQTAGRSCLPPGL